MGWTDEDRERFIRVLLAAVDAGRRRREEMARLRRERAEARRAARAAGRGPTPRRPPGKGHAAGSCDGS